MRGPSRSSQKNDGGAEKPKAFYVCKKVASSRGLGGNRGVGRKAVGGREWFEEVVVSRLSEAEITRRYRVWTAAGVEKR